MFNTPRDDFARKLLNEVKFRELVMAKGLEKKDSENLAGTAEGDAAKAGTLFAFDVKKDGSKYSVVGRFVPADKDNGPFVKKAMARIEKTRKMLKIK